MEALIIVVGAFVLLGVVAYFAAQHDRHPKPWLFNNENRIDE